MSGAMEDREIKERPTEKALARRLNDLQDQILEVRAELHALRFAAYGSLLASLVALFLASGQHPLWHESFQNV
jgi:hypothetical protein